MHAPRLIAFVAPEWAARHRRGLAAAGVDAQFVADAAALATALATDWGLDVAVLDLALATPALAAGLGPTGPRLLAFGDATHAGLALGANLADFLDPDLDPAALVAAIEAALEPPPAAGVADLSDRSIARLQKLGGEAARLSAALARLHAPPDGAPPPVDLARVRGIVRARRARDRFFPPDMFGDPAWDMLLDLVIAREEGRDVAVTSLCIAAAVPTTTALRWIRNLCEAGVFDRVPDARDARRAFIRLADATADAAARYFAGVAVAVV